MNKEYIEIFISKPYYSNGRWEAWTSTQPIHEGYQVRIPVPEHMVLARLEDAEIVSP